MIFISISQFALWTIYMLFIRIKLPWTLDLGFLVSLIMWLGWKCKKKETLKNIHKRKFTGRFFIFIVWFATFILNLNISGIKRTDMWANQFGNTIIYLMCAITGTIFICLIFMEKKIPDWLLFLGRNTLIIYSCHGLFNDLFMAIFERLFRNGYSEFQKLPVGILITVLVIICLFPVIKIIELVKNKMICENHY